MKRLTNQNLVEDAVLELEKFAPKNSAIEVDVTEEAGHFKTQIKLKTRNRTYFAKKEDLFFYKSFNKALKALVDNICTSSIIKILYLPEDGLNMTLSRRSRIASTPLLEAPSISITSIALPAVISIQSLHFPHGVKSVE